MGGTETFMIAPLERLATNPLIRPSDISFVRASGTFNPGVTVDRARDKVVLLVRVLARRSAGVLDHHRRSAVSDQLPSSRSPHRRRKQELRDPSGEDRRPVRDPSPADAEDSMHQGVITRRRMASGWCNAGWASPKYLAELPSRRRRAARANGHRLAVAISRRDLHRRGERLLDGMVRARPEESGNSSLRVRCARTHT